MVDKYNTVPTHNLQTSKLTITYKSKVERQRVESLSGLVDAFDCILKISEVFELSQIMEFFTQIREVN